MERMRVAVAHDVPDAGARSSGTPATPGTPGTPGTPATSAMSLQARLLQLVATLVTETGAGVTVAEVRAAYTARVGVPPRLLGNTIGSLRQRGRLVIVGGAHGQSRYAPAGTSQATAWEPLGDDRVALDALTAACRRQGRPVTTREVTTAHDQQVAAGGPRLQASNVNAMRVHLTALAKEQTRGGRAGRPVTVLMRREQLPTGRTIVLWWPTALGAPIAAAIAAALATQPPSAGPAHTGQQCTSLGAHSGIGGGARATNTLVAHGTVVTNSRAAHARAIAGHVTAVLGRPASRTEVSWWIERWQGVRPLATAMQGSQLGNLLATTARSDARAARRLNVWRGRLVEVKTEWTAFGEAPIRYRMGPPAVLDEPVCRFEDFATTMRVADERKGLERLARRAEALRTDALRDVAWTRQTVLATRLRTLLGRTPREYLEPRVIRMLAERERLVNETPGLNRMQRQWRERLLREHARHVQATLELMEENRLAVRSLGELKVVGEGPLIAPAALRPLLERALHARGATEGQAYRWLNGVRRFPTAPQRGRARFGSADANPLAMLDRVDAMLAIFTRFKAPHTRALLATASGILGPVLRDTRMVISWLSLKEQVDSPIRRGLLVALGMLGVAARPEGVLRDPSNPDDAAAWVLSVILADVDRAPERIKDGLTIVHGAARRVLTMALTRLQIGYPFSAIG